jgi:hypothetical protein
MNRAKRKELNRAASLIFEAGGILQSIAEAEFEAYENLPEGIQSSERGEAFYEASDTLCEQAEVLEDVWEKIGETI